MVNFSGQNISAYKIFGGQNFRQPVRFSAVLSTEILSDNVGCFFLWSCSRRNLFTPKPDPFKSVLVQVSSCPTPCDESCYSFTGYGFVTFASVAQAFRAMNDTHMIRGQYINVTTSNSKPKGKGAEGESTQNNNNNNNNNQNTRMGGGLGGMGNAPWDPMGQMGGSMNMGGWGMGMDPGMGGPGINPKQNRINSLASALLEGMNQLSQGNMSGKFDPFDSSNNNNNNSMGFNNYGQRNNGGGGFQGAYGGAPGVGGGRGGRGGN